MSIERCGNVECRRPFSVSEYGLQMPGTKEREDIICPHCGHIYKKISNGFFQTKSLTPEDEATFNITNPM